MYARPDVIELIPLMTQCVNAHDRCYGGAGAPCPWCEPVLPLRDEKGRFAAADAFIEARETKGAP